MSTELTNYNAARQALAKAHKIDEVKGIRDKAAMLAAYAKMHNDFAMQNWASEIRVRAGRRTGELLSEMAVSGQRDSGKGGNRKSRSKPSTVKLDDLGISKDDSSKCQKLAKPSEHEFDLALAVARSKSGELSESGVIRAITHNGDPPKPATKLKAKSKKKTSFDVIFEMKRIGDLVNEVLDLCTTPSEVARISDYLVSLGKTAAERRLEGDSSEQ